MRAPRSALASDTLGGHIPIVALANVAALPLDRDRVGDDTVEENGDQDGLPHDPRGTASQPRDEIALGRPEWATVGNPPGPAATEWSAVGETPTLAARLQELAVPDTILVADSTRWLTAGLFACEGLGDLAVKGLGSRYGHGVWLDAAQLWAGSRPVR